MQMSHVEPQVLQRLTRNGYREMIFQLPWQLVLQIIKFLKDNHQAYQKIYQLSNFGNYQEYVLQPMD